MNDDSARCNDDTARRPPGDAPGATCPRCGTDFTCGMEAGLDPCWCTALPPLRVAPDGALACYCRDCLNALLTASAALDGR